MQFHVIKKDKLLHLEAYGQQSERTRKNAEPHTYER